MIERLTKRNSNGDVASHVDPQKRYMLFVNRLAAYEDSGLSPEEVQKMARAKVEGRLMELPCKVGDAVWKIKSVFSYFSKPMEDRVDRIIISNNEILACCTSGTKFSIGIIGKTVFLSREEAEKALEEGLR